MSSTSKKKTFRRYFIGLVLAVLAATIFIYMQRNAIALSLLRERLAPLEERLGLKVSVDALALNSLSDVRLDIVSASLNGQQRARINQIDVALEEPSWSLKAPKPTNIKIDRAEFFVRSGGTPAGLLDDVRQLSSLRSSKIKKKKVTKTATAGRLKSISIKRMELNDLDNWSRAHLSDVEIQGDSFSAVLIIEEPLTAVCALSGRLQEVQLQCSKPIRFGDERFGFLTISAASLKTKPKQSIALTGVGVELAETVPSPIRTMFGGVTADLELEKPDNPYGAFPISLTFVLPGGGRVEGSGEFGMLGGSLEASVKDMVFGSETARGRGKLTGQYRLEVSVLKKEVLLDGGGLIEELTIEHPALADTSIGPFSIQLAGKLAARKKDDGFQIELSEGTVGVGKISGDLSSSFRKGTSFWRFELDGKTPDFPFEDLSQSIPSNLLPHVQGIRGSGELNAAVHLLIDSNDFDKTELDITFDTSKFRVRSLPPTLPFSALRHAHITRFEMPEDEDGETVIYERVLGPGDERFVMLDDMSPLLPLAVMAQEDASFRKHHGVSLFHLRGSLVDNLKKGRFVRGGSTVTMQLARNLFLNRKKTLSRKMEEIVVAWLLERSFDKDELMSLYLNAVEFGPNIFGVKEAAAHYFKRHPRALSAPQVAWLIKLLPGPRLFYEQFEKKRLSKGFMDNLNWLMRHMVRKEFMNEELYEPVTQTSLFEAPDLQALPVEPSTDNPSSLE